MIDLYTWTTPNGRKVSIMLEEIGLPYKVIPIDIGNEAQTTPEFTAINPNQKIPAIVDHDADGRRAAQHLRVGRNSCSISRRKPGTLLPQTTFASAADVMQWLMYQMSHVGPMIGQAGHFINQAPQKVPYAIERFIGESLRIVGVLNTGLTDREYLAGEYSIADIATYPWVMAAWGPFKQLMPEQLEELGNVQQWIDRVGARPAVERGMAVPPSEA